MSTWSCVKTILEIKFGQEQTNKLLWGVIRLKHTKINFAYLNIVSLSYDTSYIR